MKLDYVIVLNVGAEPLKLTTFEDVCAFIGADSPTTKIGIARKIAQAKTVDQKRAAVREFVRWANAAGLLEELRPIGEI
jgi:hypothetical protein